MERNAVLEKLYEVVRDRKDHPKDGSYTCYLFEKGMNRIAKKVGEEAVEVVIAALNESREETVGEIADLLYHLTVLMAEKEITWQDIEEELTERADS